MLLKSNLTVVLFIILKLITFFLDSLSKISEEASSDSKVEDAYHSLFTVSNKFLGTSEY